MSASPKMSRRSPRATLGALAVMVLLVGLLGGCGDDESITDAAIGNDSAVTVDGSAATDGAVAADGAVADATIADDGGLVLTDAAIADGGGGGGGGGGDASTLNLGPVDCRSNTDCPGISTCNVIAPGGICTGCGTDNDCPAALSCGPVGACIRDCSSDADCSLGKRCGVTGRCLARTCSIGTPCPEPYVCGNNQCRRPACPTNTCPAPLTCLAGTCVEP